MILLAVFGFMAGAGFGVWFLVPLLRLAVLLALAIVVGAAAAVVNAWVAFDVFVVTVCMQLGFIVGSSFEPYVGGAAKN